MKEPLVIPNSFATRPPKVGTWISETVTGMRQLLGDNVCANLKRQEKPPPWMREIMRPSRGFDSSISSSSWALFVVVTATELLVSLIAMSVDTTTVVNCDKDGA